MCAMTIKAKANVRASSLVAAVLLAEKFLGFFSLTFLGLFGGQLCRYRAEAMPAPK
jgi:hypothetical protein